LAQDFCFTLELERQRRHALWVGFSFSPPCGGCAVAAIALSLLSCGSGLFEM